MEKMSWEEALRHVGELMPDWVEQRALEAIPHYLWMERREIPEQIETADTKRKQKLMGFCTRCLQWHELFPEWPELQRTHIPEWVANDPYLPDDEPDMLEDPYVMDELPVDLLSEDEWPEFHGYLPAKTTRQKEKWKIRHGAIGYCPGCGARVMYRSLNIGYRGLYDRTLLVTYRKSAAEANTVVCVAYDVIVAWKEMQPCDEIYPPMDIEPAEVCVFRYGKGADRFLLRHCALWDDALGRYTASWTDWKHFGKCISGWQPGSSMWGNSRTTTVLDAQSFRKAINDTPFWTVLHGYPVHEADDWQYYDKISVLARLATYPCIEYLYRLGYERLAKYVFDESAGYLLYLRGKTAKSVLRLTGDQWGEIKGKRIEVTPKMLMIVRMIKARHIRLNMETCKRLADDNTDAVYGLEQILKTNPNADVARIVKYCLKNGVCLIDYKDYMDQMKLLNMNQRDQDELYPRNFAEMHGRLSARIKQKGSKITNDKIVRRLPELAEYCFSAYGLVLRPMLTSAEIVREGTVLHHCVGGYVDRYADGGTVLCCLRAEEALGKPLYTVEFTTKGEFVQCRGDHNKTAPEDEERLKLFWQLFMGMQNDLRAQRKREQKRKCKVDTAETAETAERISA